MDEEKPSLIKRLFGGASGGFKKTKTIIIAVLSIVVVLIFLSALSFPSSKKEDNLSSFDESNFSFDSMEYCTQLENRLESVLANVNAIGKVKVFVMVESSPTYKYLEETEEDEGGKKTTIYETKNGTVTSPVVVVEILPKVTGVLIVATGAKDAKMKVALTNIASTVLGVDISKVEVLEGK